MAIGDRINSMCEHRNSRVDVRKKTVEGMTEQGTILVAGAMVLGAVGAVILLGAATVIPGVPPPP